MRAERLTIRLPGELAGEIRRLAAEAGFPPATMSRLLIERAVIGGQGLDLAQRLAALEGGVKAHEESLRRIVAAVQKIAEDR